jgi:hypothetical protein
MRISISRTPQPAEVSGLMPTTGLSARAPRAAEADGVGCTDDK